MKINVQDLDQELAVTIAGDEPWLAPIYGDFPVSEGATKPRITGALRIVKEAGTVLVTGKLAYAPLLSCSRCNAAVAWPLDLTISVRYLPEEFQETKKDMTLSRNDLDAYYIEGGVVDLEALINDAVQMEIPSQVLATSENGHECAGGHGDLEGDGRVYGETATKGEADDASNPFSVLKGLKLKN